MNYKKKQSVKIFLFLFVLGFIIFNWNSVSWIFNYSEISGLVHDFFNPYQESALLAKASDINLKHIQNTQAKSANSTLFPYSEKSNSIEIPKIGIVAPLVIGASKDNNVLEKNLNNGVVYYPGSVLPGDNGQIAVLGHSAPPNWPKIKYDWVFSNISSLNLGDEIILYFNNKQYTYKVIKKAIIKPGDDIQSDGLENSNNILTLLSCWPPGKNYLRIAVSAELVKPK